MKVSTKKIRMELARKNVNMRQFCKEHGISYNTFCCIMNGRRNGNLKTIGKIANALEVDVADILENEQE